jgi:integrase
MRQGQDRDIVYLLAETGLRSGEMAGLRLDDLDFAHGTISVRRTVDRTLSVVSKPKTKSSKRTFHASPYLMNLLHPYVDGRTQGYVFRSKNHEWVTTDTILYQFRRALHRCDLHAESCNLHSLRHFNTSLMNSIGIPIKIAKDRLGHSTRADITLGTYTHTFTDDEIRSAVRIHAALLGESETKGTLNPNLEKDLRALASKHGLKLEEVLSQLTPAITTN